MKIVPLNRLLLQPTIQHQWLEQNGEIEFELTFNIQQTFEQVWRAFQQSNPNNLAAFVASDDAIVFALHEQDEVMSLLVGADYLTQQYPNFSQSFFQPNLVWRKGEEAPKPV